MSDNVCQHFMSYLKEFGLKSFSLVHSYFSACVSKEARKRKVSVIKDLKTLGFELQIFLRELSFF